MQKRIFMQSKLILIPSWGKLLGYPVLGTYKNRKVTNLLHDPVIFLSNFECTFIEEGEIRHYLFGIGFYYTKFQIGDENYIIDYRRLTGLVISDFVYQYLLNSSKISAIQDPKITLKELAFSVVFPIDQGDKTENQLSFIYGVLNREIFIPFKEIFLKFIDHLQNVPTFQFNRAKHALLMATHTDFSIIYLSESLSPEIKQEFLHPTAGIAFIAANADFILSKTFTSQEIQAINKSIITIESVFRKISLNPAYPIEYLENGFNLWKTLLNTKYADLKGLLDPSQIIPGIFATAPEYSHQIQWDKSHPRKTLESWGIQSKLSNIRPMALTEQDVDKNSIQNTVDLTNYQRGPTQHAANFELDVMKKPKVEEGKALPPIPSTSSIKDILKHLNDIVDLDYEARSIGDRFDEARNAIQKISFNSKHIWELSKLVNIFRKETSGLGLSLREKERTQLKLKEWIDEINEAERLERERLERERLERERLERERLEREQLEQERLEQERKEKERKEKDKLARERLEKEQLEREQLEREKIMLIKQKQIESASEMSRLHKEQLASLNYQQKWMAKSRITNSFNLEASNYTTCTDNLEGNSLEREFKGLQLQKEKATQKLQTLKSAVPQNKQEKRSLRQLIKGTKKNIKNLNKNIKKIKKNLLKIKNERKKK